MAERQITLADGSISAINGVGVAPDFSIDVGGLYNLLGGLGDQSGGGTVTSVSVTTAHGVSGTVATATTTPAITLTLGAITPTTIVASGAISGSNLSGTNTGDQTTVSGNAGSATVLQTARTINGVSFNGSANVTVPALAPTATLGTLPAATTVGALLCVTNANSGVGTVAFANGSAWIDVKTGLAVA